MKKLFLVLSSYMQPQHATWQSIISYFSLLLVILAFLSRELLYGNNFNRSSRKDFSLDFFVFSCFRYPRYQRIVGHMPNVLIIFCLQLRLYGPVGYNLDGKNPSTKSVSQLRHLKKWRIQIYSTLTRSQTVHCMLLLAQCGNML